MDGGNVLKDLKKRKDLGKTDKRVTTKVLAKSSSRT